MKTCTTGAETQEIATREATKKFQDKGKGGKQAMIDPVITSEIREIFNWLLTEGVALRKDKLNEQMKAFREHFSPEVLNGLNGEQLLNRMHGGIEESGLNYWLEFRNDEEFSSPKYGSIAGGSPLSTAIT